MVSWSLCIVLWLGTALAAVNAATTNKDRINTTHKDYYELQPVSRSRSRRMTVCRAGWREYQGSCYRHVKTTSTVSWHQAKELCNNNGGYLPTISSAEENNFVFNMYKSDCPNTGSAYLGLQDAMKENKFTWEDGTTSSFTNWNTGEPTKDEHCSHMFGRLSSVPSKWNNIPCTGKFASCFLCEDTPSCPHGWTPFNGKCFRHFHHATKVSWNDARAICKAVGADLASVNCADDQTFLDDLMAGSVWYYIGFTDTDSEGKFYWSDGSKGSFTKWLPNEPNNLNEEHCTHSINGQGWNDLSCSLKHSSGHYFACEM